MSIIQEALKKVQVQGDRGKTTKKPAAVNKNAAELNLLKSSSCPKNKVHSKGRKRRIIPIALFFAAVLAFAAGLFFMRSTRESNDRLSAPQGGAVLDVRQSPDIPATNFEPKNKFNLFQSSREPGQSGFVLNGIMHLDDGPKAIINNSIVREGDFVKGARVKKIDERSAVLISGGREIKLRLL